MEEDCKYSYTVTTSLTNPYKVPIKIISAELPHLNNKKIRPFSSVHITINVPQGFKDYYFYFKGLKGIPCLYVGWIDADADDLPSESW